MVYSDKQSLDYVTGGNFRMLILFQFLDRCFSNGIWILDYGVVTSDWAVIFSSGVLTYKRNQSGDSLAHLLRVFK